MVLEWQDTAINLCVDKPAPQLLLSCKIVELTGQRSNYFEGDLSSAIKHLDVID